MDALDNLLMNRYRDSSGDVKPRMVTDSEIKDALAQLSSLSTGEVSEEARESVQHGQRVHQEETVRTNKPHFAFDKADAGTDDSSAGHKSSFTPIEELVDMENLEAKATQELPVDVDTDATLSHEPLESSTVPVDVDMDPRDIADQEKGEELTSTFRPDWEVDQFLWPELCDNIASTLSHDLAAALDAIKQDCQLHICNVVAIANTHDGGGSTTMTLCLAKEAARQGLSVVILDLNHQHPQLMEELGVDCEQGIESLQLESVSPANICISAIQDGVSLLPLLQAVDLEYCSGQTVQGLVNEMSRQHDLVLIDASPEVLDSMSSKPHCRGFGIVAVHKGDEDQPSDQTSLSMIARRRDDIWNLGVIKNFAA